MGANDPISTHLEKLELPSRRAVRQRYTDAARAVLTPVIRVLARLGVSPNGLTVIGLLGSVGAAALILDRRWVLAGLVFAFGNVMDSLDGSLARHTGRTSAFGAFMDSTFDRLSEGLVIGAIGVTLAQDGAMWAVALCFLAVTASFLVSYTRARAEGLGVDSNRGGLMSRPERLVLLSAGIFFASFTAVLEVVVVLLAVLTSLTVVQRLVHVRSALAGPGGGDGGRTPVAERPEDPAAAIPSSQESLSS